MDEDEKLIEVLSRVLRFTLQHEVLNVTFTNKDGTERVMKATLKEGIVVPYENKTGVTREPNPKIVAVWDVENEGWSSIPVDCLKWVEVANADS